MACCPTDVPPSGNTYEKKAGDDIYIVGSGTKGIVYVPDIFGNTANAYRVADMLAAKGFLVVIPDFFHGEPWDANDMPPKDGWGGAPFQGFLKRYMYPSSQPAVERGITILKALGATSIGGLGFCAGGKIILGAIADGLIVSGASPHPSFFTPEDALKVKGPFCILPSKDDGTMDDVRAAFDTHPWAAKNGYKYFDDMHHGFCAARGDFNNALNKQRIDEAVEFLAAFFNNTL